jgi:hypothetical protein
VLAYLALASALPFLLSPEHKADEKEGAMVQVFTFAREWSKWYRVLRQRKGFGRLDSLRYSHWLALS